nr:MAG TPA: hypothetical protein [Caudoviricetes sp.]
MFFQSFLFTFTRIPLFESEDKYTDYFCKHNRKINFFL